VARDPAVLEDVRDSVDQGVPALEDLVRALEDLVRALADLVQVRRGFCLQAQRMLQAGVRQDVRPSAVAAISVTKSPKKAR
jgi:hypothetical protein